MILNLIALASVLTLAYFWSRYGFFPALLHLLCTIVAGAVAFGLWEPIAYALMGVAPTQGFFSFVEGMVWPASLLVPFALTLAVLRLIIDAAVPGTIKNSTLADTLGGAALGGAAAYLAVGVLVIGAGFLRMNGVLGYKPVAFDGKGSVIRAGSMWIQADRVAAGLFGAMSATTLRTGTPLAEAQPDVDVAGYALQLSHGDGGARNVMRPGDATVKLGYAVGTEAGEPMNKLLAFADGVGQQDVLFLDGQRPASGRLVGYMVEFGPGAKESFGQVTFTGGQVWLVARRGRDTLRIHPHAMVSQADPANAEGLRRWRLETQEVVIASVGGASTVNMGFEFAVPAGYAPDMLYVKNTRLGLGGIDLASYATPASLEAAIVAGSLGAGSIRIEDLDRSGASQVAASTTQGFGGGTGETGVSATNNLGFSFQVTQKGGLELDADNRIVTGRHEFFVKEVESSGVRIDPKLRVDRFAVGDGRVMIQVDVSGDKPASMLGRVYRSATDVLPPQVIDNNGTPYQAIGYVYRDGEKISVRIDPGAPIRGLAELRSDGVAVSSSRADQKLTLLFLVSQGVQITEYALGSKVVLDFEPPIEMSQSQR